MLSSDILPTPGASEECDEAAAAVEQAESELEDVLEEYKTQLKYVWNSEFSQKSSTDQPASYFSDVRN